MLVTRRQMTFILGHAIDLPTFRKYVLRAGGAVWTQAELLSAEL